MWLELPKMLIVCEYPTRKSQVTPLMRHGWGDSNERCYLGGGLLGAGNAEVYADACFHAGSGDRKPARRLWPHRHDAEIGLFVNGEVNEVGPGFAGDGDSSDYRLAFTMDCDLVSCEDLPRGFKRARRNFRARQPHCLISIYHFSRLGRRTQPCHSIGLTRDAGHRPQLPARSCHLKEADVSVAMSCIMACPPNIHSMAAPPTRLTCRDRVIPAFA